jgi:hypothetical protein
LSRPVATAPRSRRKSSLLGKQSGKASPDLVDLQTERTLLSLYRCGEQPPVGLPMHSRWLARQRVEEARPAAELHA